MRVNTVLRGAKKPFDGVKPPFNRFRPSFRPPDLIGALLPALCIIIWQILSETNAIPAFMLPSPRAVFHFTMDFAFGLHDRAAFSGSLAGHLMSSAGRVAAGFSIAVAVGLTLGYMSGSVSLIFRLVNPFVMLMRSVPGIGWLPVSIVWFGVGEKNTVFLIALAAFFPIYANTVHSVVAIDDEYFAVANVFGASRIQILRHVILPLSFSGVTVGLRLGMGISWAYLVLGEMTGVNSGLGAVMADGRMLGQTHIILVCMAVIAAAGAAADFVLSAVCRVLNPNT